MMDDDRDDRDDDWRKGKPFDGQTWEVRFVLHVMFVTNEYSWIIPTLCCFL
jgi:hypothetical protein